LGEGLPYLLWGHVDVSPLSSPSSGERKRNSLTLAGEFLRRLPLGSSVNRGNPPSL
jgi:hypothetical protein